MRRAYEINPAYIHLKQEILSIPERFDREGETIYTGRNTLKVIEVAGVRMCIKSFKHPHIINKFVYAFFRKSKAERSFLYASHLQELGVGTPEPIACILYKDRFGLTKSYYICRQLDHVMTIRGIKELPLGEQDFVYSRFADFTYDFHRKGVYFVDHSPGNTLIGIDKEGQPHFWLVDLNRTKFGSSAVPYEKGLKNLSMLELPEDKLRVIAEEYASLWHKDKAEAVRELIHLTEEHNKYVERKSWLRDTRRAVKRRLCP